MEHKVLGGVVLAGTDWYRLTLVPSLLFCVGCGRETRETQLHLATPIGRLVP